MAFTFFLAWAKKRPFTRQNNETGAPAGFVSGTCAPFTGSKAAQFLAICGRPCES